MLCLVLLLEQSSLSALDIETTFSEEDFLNIVIAHHPIVKKADLLNERATFQVLKARGEFDPKLSANLGQKYFEEKSYYSLLNSTLKIPTWFGTTVEAGFDRNSGEFLNPENFTTDPELWFLGVSVPIGQGLFIDKRRADLRKAQSLEGLNEAERLLIYNELLFDASIAYWDWYEAYYKLEVSKQALQNAEFRKASVINNFINGFSAGIDTLEASIQVQSRKVKLLNIELEHQKKRFLLETFLWKDGVFPLELSISSAPDEFKKLSPEAIDVLFSQIGPDINDHPKLGSLMKKLEIQDIDMSLKRENLKPKINVKYNALGSNTNTSELFSSYSTNNYSWGVNLEFPLFLRKERGKYNLSKIKFQELNFDLELERVVLKNKAKATYSEFISLIEQLEVTESLTQNFQILYEAEQELFRNGESSLFLINSREKNWLETRLTLVKKQSELAKSKAKYKYATASF